jgi:hypothetical protein
VLTFNLTLLSKVNLQVNYGTGRVNCSSSRYVERVSSVVKRSWAFNAVLSRLSLHRLSLHVQRGQTVDKTFVRKNVRTCSMLAHA